MKITKNELLKLGFLERFSTPEESGEPKGFKYYVYEVKGKCLLISDCNTDNDNDFTIELFDFENVIFYTLEEVTKIVKVIEFNSKA